MSEWINHVKKYAKDNNMSYPQALKDAKCSEAYVKVSPTKKTKVEVAKVESPKMKVTKEEMPTPTPTVKVTKKKQTKEQIVEDIEEEKPMKKVIRRTTKKPVIEEEEIEEETIAEPVKKTRAPRKTLNKFQQTEAVEMIDESLHKPKKTKKVL